MIRRPHFFFILPFLLIVLPWVTFASSNASRYELAISFEPEKGRMSGTAHISLLSKEEMTVFLKGITVTGILLHRNGHEALTMSLPKTEELTFPASQEVQEIYISYTKNIHRSYANRIKEDGIVLTANWYPQPDQDMYYTLLAQVPKGFTAISESDELSFASGKEIQTFSLSQALPGIHFIAAPYKVDHLKVRAGLTISTLFFEESLSQEYLQATASYIERYESEFGSFPYNHYAIVENHLPTGYGMPTFTLLGSSVIRLPFIKDTSLGHEILHSWFGNSVGVDMSGGNWCEGLTSYLADWTFREEKGEGTTNRKENILGYLSYVSPEKAIPLSEFTSPSHTQPMARAMRAVGYTRGAMLFHELKLQIGVKSFLEGLRLLVKEFSGDKASWKDLQNVFETTSLTDLTTFFSERLSRKKIPDLFVTNILTRSDNGKVNLSFDLVQRSDTPFTLSIPLLIKTAEKELYINKNISETKTTINLGLPDPPLSLTIDPGYNIMRKLGVTEIAPLWSQFMGADKKLIIFASEEEEAKFYPFLQRFKDRSWIVHQAKDVKNSDLDKASLLFLGIDSNVSRSLFGLPNHPKEGFTLDVRTNPLNDKYTAVLISSKNSHEVAAVVHRLSHYGKYSYLHFQGGKIITKDTHTSNSGDTYVLEQLPMGAPVSSINTFDTIANKLSLARVVYVGENHTSYADHLLQLRLIQALYARNPNLAIGMEMFPQSSQEALDEYILSTEEVNEATFLKKSRYFNVWRYDWRFFQDIFNFAKRNKIPVRGLNLERDIVSQVFKQGSTDDLSEEAKKNIPVNRDLSMQGYRERLEAMYSIHMQGGHGRGMMPGFIQAQGLWDETMAQAIADYLTDNPQKQMVVLAGSQHTRKDSGIPPRVARRLDIKQASVINIHEGEEADQLKKLTDYYFMAHDQQLPPTAKIGIVLDEIEEDGIKFMQIIQLSPHGNGGKAGLQEKDILLAIDNHPIHEMVDVKIAMIGTRENDIASLTIRRNDDHFINEELTLEVQLYIPGGDKPHP